MQGSIVKSTDIMGLRKVPDGPLREGFTTGTSATAAAKAALLSLLKQEAPEFVRVYLPIEKQLVIPVHQSQFNADQATCSVIKDAGDDPDVTNGAEIGCIVQLVEEPGIHFERGEGVGIVTLPGLELAVGEPAINPVPRKMISDALQKILHDADLECGVRVVVFVRDGEKLAKRTLNERVGIMEGLSILGTTGIVKPYSASSYIASIEQGVDVAVANGINELIISSGARSEKYLRTLFSNHSEQAFIHYGNWIGETLRKIDQEPISKVSIGIMMGKAAKLAEGRTDTHSCIASWNKEFIASLAIDAGYKTDIKEEILSLNMAGRLMELFPFESSEPFYQKLLEKCFEVAQKEMKQVELDIYLISKTGTYIKYKKNDIC